MGYLKSFLKKIIPERIRPALILFYLKLISPFYFGNKVHCPCCDKSFRGFLSYSGVKSNRKGRCPGCGCLERHRLLWLYLKNKTAVLKDHLRVLHFAPEYILQKRFKSLSNIEYISADLFSPLAMIKMDITDIKYQNNFFDMIICSHVLAHVDDDHKGIEELFRILKPAGVAIIQTPIDQNREHTFEEPSAQSFKEREKIYGDGTFVRIYGKNFQSRVESVGFRVIAANYTDELNDETIQKCGLPKNDIIFLCSKTVPEK